MGLNADSIDYHQRDSQGEGAEDSLALCAVTKKIYPKMHAFKRVLKGRSNHILLNGFQILTIDSFRITSQTSVMSSKWRFIGKQILVWGSKTP